MKTLLCALLFGGICLAEDESPKHARVSVQYIEVAHTALTDLLGEGNSGAAIHAQAIAMAKSGDAKILETAVVVCRDGRKASIWSVLEEIYPTEYDAEAFKWSGLKEWPNSDHTQRAYPVFETNDIGLFHYAELTIDSDSSVVDLRVRPEFVRRLNLETWHEHKDQWGDASLRMPTYEKWATDTALALVSGKSELVSIITPEAQPPAPESSRRVLLFVRADVIVTPLKP